ncbi:hypothetical protein F441_17314 [Phytophthora nicotianae CJ01A1]|uniref:Uncharacterized protein n=4 Tax=Phytophthora nicotianae TaxID=4792 RepID=W2QYC3_PHYN3|nr:hypothetical protein PPTG_03882 [Phytophthora nicotianae INRA-310]ETK76672.1 hypothetical protein L915_16968 [Phytophthora nicotianae]ETN18212.1 hypothetical protein PPTG_03882 [Phytophthora nicotianae INRA-310]ETP06264.1 hypothetical protein F441_17314 [Phytophthora nicotianae CJ01A1]
MVRDVRPDSTFSNSKVTGFYFRPYRNEYDEAVLEYSRCCCGAVRKQTNRSGYYTLMQHVLRQFPGHESVMLQATTAETGSVLNFVSHSSRNLYGWLDAMDHRIQPPILVLRASRGKTILKFGPHIGGDSMPGCEWSDANRRAYYCLGATQALWCHDGRNTASVRELCSLVCLL